VSPVHAQGLLEALRYLWRGTRWSGGKERYVGRDVAGYLFTPQGAMRPFGQIHEAVVLAYRRADLQPIERLVVSEYFGLVAFPTDLANGPNPLLGRVRTSTSRQSDFASRSAIAAARNSGVTAIARVLEPTRTNSPMPLAPIGDPLHDEALRRRLGMEEGLNIMVLEGCLYAAYDLTDRAAKNEEIRRALDAWKAQWITDTRVPAESHVSFAARHAAFAALHVALWSSGTPGARTRTEEAPAPVVVWPPTAIDSPKAGRVIETERWGVIDQADLTAADLVCLCGLIFNDEDETGSAVDFVIPILAHPDVAPPINRRTYELLVWAVIRYLASRGDWRAMELVMAVAASERRPTDIALFLAWAAHVASMFHHEALAWRLANQADRLIDQRPEQRRTTGRIVLQVRSGICVRAADVLLDFDPKRGAAELRRSMHYIQQARLLGRTSPRAGAVTVELPVDLRLVEVLLVAHRYRSRGNETGIGEAVSVEFIKAAISDAKRKVAGDIDPNDDDFTVLMARIKLLEDAIAVAELDDSALGPFLGHET